MNVIGSLTKQRRWLKVINYNSHRGGKDFAILVDAYLLEQVFNHYI